METESNLNFDALLVKVGAVQIGYFSNQTEIQLFQTSPLFPTSVHLSINTIEKSLTYLYMSWYIPRNCGDAIIEM